MTNSNKGIRTERRLNQLIARRIRQMRRAKNISQEELGRAVGVTFQQIQKIERGINRVSAGRLVLLAGALGVSIVDLSDGVKNG